MKYRFTIFSLFFCILLQAKEYHVSPDGSDVNEGRNSSPLKSINAAAQKAQPGDVVIVHQGTYREWVNPLNGGESDSKRIVYCVADGEKAELKGSELIKTWQKEKNSKTVWKVIIPNSFFGNYNPYSDKIFGDWFSNHGPYIIDNNLFLSRKSIWESSDGGLFTHNLFAGNINRNDDSRYTPYHLNHSTEVKGVTIITNGDHRFYNNIFVGGKSPDANYGLCVYDPAKWPIYAEDNIFCNGAKPMTGKSQGIVDNDFNPGVKLEETTDGVYLSFTADKSQISALKTKPVDAARLGITRLSGLPFEHANGTPFQLLKDYLGVDRSKYSPTAGPIESLSSENTRIKIW